MPAYPTYKLSEIAHSTKGKKPKSVSKEKTDGFEIPYVDIKAFEKGIVDNYTDGENCTFCKPDDVLIVWDGARCGFVGRGVEGAIGSTLAKICSDKYTNDFLFYFLQSKYKVLNSNPRGVGIPHIEPNLLWNFEIPDVDKTTQHAIVTRIESLFAELDKAVQHLRTAQQQLKTYRQAVLKDAFEGCENAEKHLFGELMADVRNGYGAKPTNCGTNKLLRISSVRAMNLNLDDFRFNNSSFDERDIIQENDLLFTRYNGSVDLVGVCAYVPELYDTYAYPDKIIRCRPKVCNTFHSKFLQYYINQGKAREFVRSKIKTTSGQNGISGSDIKKIEIPLPPLTEQQRIVKEIESRLSQATASETYIENALQQAEALRQSILKKAFSGELV